MASACGGLALLTHKDQISKHTRSLRPEWSPERRGRGGKKGGERLNVFTSFLPQGKSECTCMHAHAQRLGPGGKVSSPCPKKVRSQETSKENKKEYTKGVRVHPTHNVGATPPSMTNGIVTKGPKKQNKDNADGSSKESPARAVTPPPRMTVRGALASMGSNASWA